MKIIMLFLVFLLISSQEQKPTLTIGAKLFAESRILAEMVAQIAQSTGEANVVRRFGMDTNQLFPSVEQGNIDIYPEYTGTILQILFKTDQRLNVYEINKEFKRLYEAEKQAKKHQVEITYSLGFENSFAIAMLEEVAQKRNINKISDLAQHRDLIAGFKPGFRKRRDGYVGLKKRYGLDFTDVRGIDPGLRYDAIASKKIHVTEIYTTDGKLTRFKLRLLEDDLSFFPKYYCVFLYHKDFKKKFPKTYDMIKRLENRISRKQMTAMNARAEMKFEKPAKIAAEFLKELRLGLEFKKSAESGEDVIAQILLRGKEHIIYVAISLLLAMLVAIPLGIIAFHYKGSRQIILGFTGVFQTIPSLALFCFVIPVLGIGAIPAIFAVFLYSLLPIVRNTLSGLEGIDPKLNESASALGLSGSEKLFLIQLPLASRSILTGIKISAVINVGTTTLAAFIGAGGLGVLIMTGLSLNHIPTVLSGAIPAAILALLVQGLFELLGLVVTPRGLRLKLH